MNLQDISTEDLKNELVNRGFIDVFWNEEDIRVQAAADDINLTEDQVFDISENISNTFDANIGVNWEVIQHNIRFIVGMK